MLPERIKDRYKEQKLWKQTMDNPNLKLCPREDCKEGVVDLQMNPPRCRKCQRQYCAQCMMAYHSGSCDDNFEEHFQNYKRCPSCGIMIERIVGCNHITCRCSFHFCFGCGAPWSDTHYNCASVRGGDYYGGGYQPVYQRQNMGH